MVMKPKPLSPAARYLVEMTDMARLAEELPFYEGTGRIILREALPHLKGRAARLVRQALPAPNKKEV